MYCEKYGEEDKRTKECSTFLQTLTGKAVELQKWLQNKEKMVPNMIVSEVMPDSSISEILTTVNGIPATPTKISTAISADKVTAVQVSDVFTR